MRLKLPPLKTLNCFIICAKNLSFTKTASELNLTQGAVSKQIGLLENHLGLQLFERKNSALELTKSAKIYLREIEKALKNIETATAKIMAAKPSHDNKITLSINSLPSLSSRWLIPLLKDFETKFPDYDVVVKIGDGEIDFDKIDCDLAVRVAQKANWKNLTSIDLMGEELVCICSPQYKKKHAIKNLKDLTKCNLLRHTYRPQLWQKYFEFFGIKKTKLHHSNSFEHFFMLIEAAKNGLGVGLAPRFLLGEELKKGEVVIAVKADFKSNYRYFLLSRKQKKIPQKVADFTNWIKTI